MHKVSSSQASESKQGQNKNEPAIISQPPILASAPQALFLPKMLSTVRAHNLRVRFCKSNGREDGAASGRAGQDALSAVCRPQKADESLQFVVLPRVLEGMRAADTDHLPIHARLL